jgi:hypothetical protein
VGVIQISVVNSPGLDVSKTGFGDDGEILFRDIIESNGKRRRTELGATAEN